MYSFVKIMHTILIQCHGNYIEVEKLEISIKDP